MYGFHSFLLMVLLCFRIPHYEQRLKSLVYKKSFNDRMAELKPQIQGIISTVCGSVESFIFADLNKLRNVIFINVFRC